VDELDADPWLLNTPRGTVDLRIGEERSHKQGDLLTKITGVAPDSSCPTPVWSNHDMAKLVRAAGGRG
jgi:putative DNA primase/helicase